MRLVHVFCSASSVNIGQVLGSLIGGYCGGQYGPRRTILVSCVVASLGWLLLGLAHHVSLMVVGRIVCGIGSSFSTANCSLLVAQYRYPVSCYVVTNHR